MRKQDERIIHTTELAREKTTGILSLKIRNYEIQTVLGHIDHSAGSKKLFSKDYDSLVLSSGKKALDDQFPHHALHAILKEREVQDDRHQAV